MLSQVYEIMTVKPRLGIGRHLQPFIQFRTVWRTFWTVFLCVLGFNQSSDHVWPLPTLSDFSLNGAFQALHRSVVEHIAQQVQDWKQHLTQRGILLHHAQHNATQLKTMPRKATHHCQTAHGTGYCRGLQQGRNRPVSCETCCAKHPEIRFSGAHSSSMIFPWQLPAVLFQPCLIT